MSKRTATLGVVIHTTAGNSANTPEQVQNFFLNILRWSRGGYHNIYSQDGRKREYYNWRDEWTNGILPGGQYHNFNTIHLSYIGGINNRNQNEAVCNISPKQEEAIVADLKTILAFYPSVKILGHNQVNQKACPSFWVPDWLRAWGFEEKNIETRDPFRLKDWVKRLPHPPDFYKNRDGKRICECCGQRI
ncbi:MAG: hypothetical protein VKL39_24180 [Leptolyngbyaceae bacterium]|nr:hypothetical protein [Leptolyngbyaceae bacterium]